MSQSIIIVSIALLWTEKNGRRRRRRRSLMLPRLKTSLACVPRGDNGVIIIRVFVIGRSTANATSFLFHHRHYYYYFLFLFFFFFNPLRSLTSTHVGYNTQLSWQLLLWWSAHLTITITNVLLLLLMSPEQYNTIRWCEYVRGVCRTAIVAFELRLLECDKRWPKNGERHTPTIFVGTVLCWE